MLVIDPQADGSIRPYTKPCTHKKAPPTEALRLRCFSAILFVIPKPFQLRLQFLDTVHGL